MRTHESVPIPNHLHNSNYEGEKKLGNGIGYKYAHDYPNHYVEQQYLPDGLTDEVIFEPGSIGYEKEIIEYFNKIKGKDKN